MTALSFDVRRQWFPLLVGIFLAINLALAAHAIFMASRVLPEWTLGSWLHSYAGGFGRRGVAGELILRLSDATGLSLTAIVQAMQIGLNLIFLSLIFLLVRDRVPSFWLILLLVSPATIDNRWLDPTTSGQKELVIFILLAAWALRLRAGPMTPPWLAGFAVAAMIATLSHEMLLVASPFFAAAYLLQQRRNQWAFSWVTFVIIPAACFLTWALVFAFGTEALAASCDAVVARGMPAKICSGSLDASSALGENISYTLGYASDHAAMFVNLYPMWALLILIPSFLAWNEGDSTKGGVREFVLLALLCSVLLLPLYIAGVDWGRWLAIGATSTLVLGAMVAPHRTASGPVSGPAISLKRVTIAVSIVFALLYASSWSLDRCCGATMPSMLSRILH